MLSFFQRDVLDEILDLTDSVSEGFPTYSCSSFSCFHFSLDEYCLTRYQRSFLFKGKIFLFYQKAVKGLRALILQEQDWAQ